MALHGATDRPDHYLRIRPLSTLEVFLGITAGGEVGISTGPITPVNSVRLRGEQQRPSGWCASPELLTTTPPGRSRDDHGEEHKEKSDEVEKLHELARTQR